jgi:hypothetical protein
MACLRQYIFLFLVAALLGAAIQPADAAGADWSSLLREQGVRQDSKKKALLIGVSRYAHSDGSILSDLAGPVNDVRMLRDEFVQPLLGFARNEILVLENEQATGGLIRAVMENWFLTGSRVEQRFFFFAGHGSSLPDLNHDELDDLDDEIILPYDAAFDRDGNWLPATVLIDDQWHDWFSRIKGQPLIAMLDTCHSGSGFRSLGTRSTGSSIRSRYAGNFRARGKLTKKKKHHVQSRLTETAVPAGHVYLYASQPDQRAFEREYGGQVHGCFSQALVRSAALVNRKAGRGSPVSWDAFFTELDTTMRNSMNLDQSPDIEPGPGDARLQAPFYAVPLAVVPAGGNHLPDPLEFRVQVLIKQPKNDLLQKGDFTGLRSYVEVDFQDQHKNYLLRIDIAPRSRRVEVLNANGYLLNSFQYSSAADLRHSLEQRLKQAYLWGLLTEIRSGEPLPLDVTVLDSRGREYTGNNFYIGQTISYRMRSRTDGYLYMLGLDGSGRLDLLYPFACQREKLRAGRAILLPDPKLCGSDVVWELEGEPGEEMIKFIISPVPLNVDTIRPDQGDMSSLRFEQALDITLTLIRQLRNRNDWYSGERCYFKYSRQAYNDLY